MGGFLPHVYSVFLWAWRSEMAIWKHHAWLLGSLFTLPTPVQFSAPVLPGEMDGLFWVTGGELWWGEHEGLPSRQLTQQSLASALHTPAVLASVLNPLWKKNCFPQEGLGTPGQKFFYFILLMYSWYTTLCSFFCKAKWFTYTYFSHYLPLWFITG